uniref:ALS_ss_C domain-containing protein n=1 Tax=Heterorhabditis bacteriophora TaxID=37862 RepID=A0A1I7WPL6_HETBA
MKTYLGYRIEVQAVKDKTVALVAKVLGSFKSSEIEAVTQIVHRFGLGTIIRVYADRNRL